MSESETELRIKQSERPTIMSGKVVTFALDFRKVEGVFGLRDESTGPFEVSASRDAVMVHRAECTDAEQVDLLIEALILAKAQLLRFAPLSKRVLKARA